MPESAERPAPLHAAPFPATLWSVVLHAGQNSERSREALATLCQAYWLPLYAFLRRQGNSPHDAEDLTQGFLLYLLEKNTLSRAQRERGKFRSFLLTCLKYYVEDERDRQRAQKRGGNVTLVSLDSTTAEAQYQFEPADQQDPAKTFDRRWAMTVLNRAMLRLEQEHATPERQKRFRELKVYLLGDKQAAAYTEVARQLGLREGAVKVAVSRLRERFGKLLRAEIAGTVASPAEVEEELRHLLAALSE